MGTESVNKWSCLRFSLAVSFSEATEQTVGPLCWNGEWTPVPSECPLWLWGYQTYVSSVLCLLFITPLILLLGSWLCAPGKLCLSVAARLFHDQPNLSPADLVSSRSPPTQEPIRSDGSEVQSLGRLHRSGQVGLPRLRAAPRPPPRSHFLQDTVLPSWSRQAQLCFGSAAVHTRVGEGPCLSLFLEIICLSTSLTVTITRAVCCVSQQKDTCC